MRAAPNRVALVLALLGLAGCTSRTLPLPPPTIEPLSAPDAQGMVVVRGLVLEGAFVGVFNERTGEGVIVTSSAESCESCPFQATLAAEPSDDILVWQFFETEGAEYATWAEPAAP